jgi:nitrile hydratase accessory protein
MSQTTAPHVVLPVHCRDQEGPVFNEPWEAHAFALAVRLSEVGFFTWQEWTSALSQEIQAAQQMSEADLDANYYQLWLRALEKLCALKGLVSATDLFERKEQWRHAYLHTPHGQPVSLG